MSDLDRGFGKRVSPAGVRFAGAGIVRYLPFLGRIAFTPCAPYSWVAAYGVRELPTVDRNVILSNFCPVTRELSVPISSPERRAKRSGLLFRRYGPDRDPLIRCSMSSSNSRAMARNWIRIARASTSGALSTAREKAARSSVIVTGPATAKCRPGGEPSGPTPRSRAACTGRRSWWTRPGSS